MRAERMGTHQGIFQNPLIESRQLTYMLIDEAIEAAKRAGELVPARPIVDWEGEPRAFLMCRPLVQAIENGRNNDDDKTRMRWARLEADIGHFVQGGFVTDDLIKQLKPWKYEHWELRSLRPSPSLRVFGRFAKPDVFIGTHVRERNGMGGMWSIQFELEKLACEDHWTAAGLPAPFTAAGGGFPYDAYITENAVRKRRIPK